MKVFYSLIILLGLINISLGQDAPKAACGNPIPIDFDVEITSIVDNLYSGQAISVMVNAML